MMQNNQNDTLFATYRKHPDPQLNGNPLIEALDVMLNKEDVLSKLHRPHPTANSFQSLPNFYKKTQLNHFRKVISPHQTSFYMYHKFMELILCGYIDRNPLTASDIRLRTTIGENAQKGAYDDSLNLTFGMTSAPSCVITGISGASKTTTARSVLSLIPQVIQHKEFEGQPFMQKQLTYVSFDCAATKSPKALALSFFAAVDKVLGTQYFQQWERRSKDSVERFYANMQLVAAKHHIGLIHIDEVQFFLKHIGSSTSPDLAVIESLFNKIGIPVILSCTLEGLDLFEPVPSSDSTKLPDITTTRRMLSEREFVFGTYSLESPEFEEIYKEFFPESICLGGVPSKEFKLRFHRLSVGIPAIINRLARLHHEQIIITKKHSTDDIDTLNSVYKSQFRHIDFALEQIRNSNLNESPTPQQLKNYEKELPRKNNGNADWENTNANKEKPLPITAKVPEISEYGNSSDSSNTVNIDDDFESGI
jgi:hypothetical protein